MKSGVRWWQWLADPWDAVNEVAATRLAERCLLLCHMYPALREWPRADLIALAAMTRGTDPEVARLAAEKWAASAEHEQGHR